MKLKMDHAGHKEKIWEALFILGLFVFYFLWAYIQPFNVSPDEQMRYLIPQYIYNHGALPVGSDPEIMNAVWGSSYGFNPIFSYIISAGMMKIAALFSQDSFVLLMAARMASVLFGVGTGILALKISKKLFAKKALRWLFVVLITLWPQAVFVTSYVNTDAFAIFTTAMVIYAWLLGMESGWKYAHCVFLGISIGLCLMSYYNAYGFVLCSAALFIITNFWFRDKILPLRVRVLAFVKKTLAVCGVVFACTGWWFIRSYILYDGDMLGMRACDACAEQYAVPEFKPSLRSTPYKNGLSLSQMLFEDQWLRLSGISFMGTFGAMSILLKKFMYVILSAVCAVGGGGILLHIRSAFGKNTNARQKRLRCFQWIMLISMVFPIALSIYYSYYSDFQPQGRYVLPLLIPLMYFVTLGIGKLTGHLHRKYPKAELWCTVGVIALVVLVGLCSYFMIFRQAYAG